MTTRLYFSSFFFFNDTATTEIYTLSLHDALPICSASHRCRPRERATRRRVFRRRRGSVRLRAPRSEEHTSELQSQSNLVCRLLLEKKKKLISMTSTRTCCVRPAQHDARRCTVATA